MDNNTNTTRAYSALFYLITRLLKEQIGLLITILVFIIILAILPMIHNDSMNELNVDRISGFFGIVAWLPSLMICLAILPIIHQQIFSSSILKRLKASGISALTYAIIMIASFTLVSTLIFWVISLITQPIYAAMYIGYEFGINWFAFLIISPVIWFAFATTGILIGNWKIPEVLKGILIFFIIALITIFSSTVLNPVNLDMPIIQGEKFTVALLAINPWGLMLNTLHNSIVNTGSNSYEMMSIIISVLLSGALFLIAINRISLR